MYFADSVAGQTDLPRDSSKIHDLVLTGSCTEVSGSSETILSLQSAVDVGILILRYGRLPLSPNLFSASDELLYSPEGESVWKLECDR